MAQTEEERREAHRLRQRRYRKIRKQEAQKKAQKEAEKKAEKLKKRKEHCHTVEKPKREAARRKVTIMASNAHSASNGGSNHPQNSPSRTPLGQVSGNMTAGCKTPARKTRAEHHDLLTPEQKVATDLLELHEEEEARLDHHVRKITEHKQANCDRHQEKLAKDKAEALKLKDEQLSLSRRKEEHMRSNACLSVVNTPHMSARRAHGRPPRPPAAGIPDRAGELTSGWSYASPLTGPNHAVSNLAPLFSSQKAPPSPSSAMVGTNRATAVEPRFAVQPGTYFYHAGGPSTAAQPNPGSQSTTTRPIFFTVPPSSNPGSHQPGAYLHNAGGPSAAAQPNPGSQSAAAQPNFFAVSHQSNPGSQQPGAYLHNAGGRSAATQPNAFSTVPPTSNPGGKNAGSPMDQS